MEGSVIPACPCCIIICFFKKGIVKWANSVIFVVEVYVVVFTCIQADFVDFDLSIALHLRRILKCMPVLWQSLIILRWPSVAERILKSNC